MKKITLLTVALISFVSISIAPLITGCKSAQTAAYKGVATVQVTADAAMTAWGDYVGKFHPGAQTEQKVKDAYGKYQLAMFALADAGAAWSQANGTTNAPNAQQIYNAALSVASASLSDLVALLQSIGVKI